MENNRMELREQVRKICEPTEMNFGYKDEGRKEDVDEGRRKWNIMEDGRSERECWKS